MYMHILSGAKWVYHVCFIAYWWCPCSFRRPARIWNETEWCIVYTVRFWIHVVFLLSLCCFCSSTLRWRHMGAIASQITSLMIVYSTVYSDAGQRKHQSSASLAFVRGIHRGPVNSPHKWSVTRKCFHLMTSSWTTKSFESRLYLPAKLSCNYYILCPVANFTKMI